MSYYDVIVVGGGNAGLCAALSAAEHGSRVMVLDRAPYKARGGNSAFTMAAYRFVHNGLPDMQRLMPDLSESEIARTDFGSYSDTNFFDDMAECTQYRADPDLVETLVQESFDGVAWLKDQGVRFVPMYGTQGYEVEGRYVLWGGVTVEAVGGGVGLVDFLEKACANAAIQIQYGARVRSLQVQHGRVTGVRFEQDGELHECAGGAVVLASGGFQASTEKRTAYLGANWELAKVRGTRYNTGDGIQMALDAGASSRGNYSGCHAVAWDMNAPEFGDLQVRDGYQRHSYPLSVTVNLEGERFLDEGADFFNKTYAKYGAEILRQPGQVAWQVFDGKALEYLRHEYKIREVTRVQADSIEALGTKMEGVNAQAFLSTIQEYNAAVEVDRKYDPNRLDGRGTSGLEVNKTNWAQPLDTPPYEAYGVTCGITFTYGGLRVGREGAVVSDSGDALPGLFAAGELLGGLFYFNYPGGAGLMSGTVFGRRAGASAAAYASGP